MERPDGVTINWAAPGTPPIQAICRNCGAAGAKPVLLDAQARLQPQPPIAIRMLGCPGCGCAFAEQVPEYSYEGEAPPQAVASYVESGAGLWPIVRTLARLELAAGAQFLEIGCGFGFGLDYAIRARGWRGNGIDPSPLAASGRILLDVPIESRFFGDRDEDVAGPGGGADCILASEVLEHMADPATFVITAQRGLSAGGVLVLTTPDRTQLHAGASLTDQIPLLSAGAHLVLQTTESLRLLLQRCGFASVEIEVNGAQLIAYAAMVPLVLQQDNGVLRQRYRSYLDRRALETAGGTMLWWAFAGRAYQEAVADTDSPVARRWWAAIQPAWHSEYGMDPDEPAVIVAPPTGARLEWLASIGPHAMPGLFYARALDRLHGGASLAEVAPHMRAAADAAAVRTAVLMSLGAPEIATLGVERAALEALAAVAADKGAPECLDVLGAAVAAAPLARLSLVRRSYVGLVNAGALAQADALRAQYDIGERALLAKESGHSVQERDVLLCLGIAKLPVDGCEDDATACFERAMRASVPDDAAWWSALRGVCLANDRAGRHARTMTLLRGAPRMEMPEDLLKRLGKEGLLF